MTAHALRGPIAGLNALSCESPTQLHQFVHDLGDVLGIQPEAPQVYQAKIDGVVFSGGRVPAEPPVKQRPLDSNEALGPAAPRVERRAQADTEEEYRDAEAVIRHHCEQEWPDDFSMRAYCMQQQHKAVAQLRLGRPQDVPEEVFCSIRRKCTAEWPDDYAMRVYCEQQQLDGYHRVTEKK